MESQVTAGAQATPDAAYATADVSISGVESKWTMHTDFMNNAVLSAKATSANKLIIERGAGNRELPGGTRLNLTVGPLQLPGSARSVSDLVVSTETSDAARIDRAGTLSPRR